MSQGRVEILDGILYMQVNKKIQEILIILKYAS